MVKHKIQILYKTEQGTEFPSYQEALVADRLQKSPLYLSEYQVKDIVSFLCSRFIIKEKPPILQLSEADAAFIQNQIDNPPEPTPALIKAIEDYKEKLGK